MARDDGGWPGVVRPEGSDAQHYRVRVYHAGGGRLVGCFVLLATYSTVMLGVMGVLSAMGAGLLLAGLWLGAAAVGSALATREVVLDGGVLRFVAPRGERAVPVAALRRVKFSEGDSDTGPRWLFEHAGGHETAGEIVGAGDLLARLRALNPAVEVAGWD